MKKLLSTHKKYDTPYIYVAYPDGQHDIVASVLSTLRDEHIAIMDFHIDSRRRKNELRCCFGVLLFVTSDYQKSDAFHWIVNEACTYNKNILTIYLDDFVQTTWSSMQLGSSQALFVSNYENIEALCSKLKNAQIFKHMTITKEQKQLQKKRSLAFISAPILTAILLFFTVIYPLLIAPVSSIKHVTNQWNLTLDSLKKATELHIVGNEVFDTDVHAWYEDNTHKLVGYDKDINGVMVHQDPISIGSLENDDLAFLQYMDNLEVLELEGQQITNISPLFKLKNLRNLRLNCNPISSLEGIENLSNLQVLIVSDTYILDLSPAFQLENLCMIQVDDTYVTSLSGIENLHELHTLMIDRTDVNSVPKLSTTADCFTFSAREVSLSSLAFLEDITYFNELNFDGTFLPTSEVLPYISNKPIENLYWENPRITSLIELQNINVTSSLRFGSDSGISYLENLEGIEHFEGIETLNIYDNHRLTDLSPILQLDSLQILYLSPDMKSMAEAQLSDASFEIIYENW